MRTVVDARITLPPRCCHYRCVQLWMLGSHYHPVSWMLGSHYHPVSCIMQADSGNFLNKRAWLGPSKLLLPGRIKEYFYDIFDWVSILCPNPIVSQYLCIVALLCSCPVISKSHRVPVLLCPGPIVFLSFCTTVPLHPSLIVSHFHYVPAPVPLCSSLIVSQSHYVPGHLCFCSLCHSPIASLSHSVPVP